MNNRHKIRSFGRLKEDWDSYGSGPIPKKAIRYALKVLDLLEDSRKDIKSIGPCGDGCVTFETEDGEVLDVYDTSTVYHKSEVDVLVEYSNTINLTDKLLDIMRFENIKKSPQPKKSRRKRKVTEK